MLDIIEFTYQMKHKFLKQDNRIKKVDNKNFQQILHYKLFKRLKPLLKEDRKEENQIIKILRKDSKIIDFTLKFLKERK